MTCISASTSSFTVTSHDEPGPRGTSAPAYPVGPIEASAVRDAFSVLVVLNGRMVTSTIVIPFAILVADETAQIVVFPCLLGARHRPLATEEGVKAKPRRPFGQRGVVC